MTQQVTHADINAADATGTDGECVLLLHGLWMNRLVMLPLARVLRNAGFSTVAPSYRSVRGSLQENVDLVARQIASLDARRIHIVGHSLGGVLALVLLARAQRDTRLGRIVLLGAPVAGCHSGRVMASRHAARRLLGESAAVWTRLAVDAFDSVPTGCEVGALAGSRRVGLGRLFVDIPGDHDGVVRVDETRVAGLADHLVLPVSHSGMLVSPRVARQCVAFLRDGRFQR